MSDTKSKKPISIGGKPLTIGGKATGRKSAPAGKAQTPAKSPATGKTERVLKILEKQDAVTAKLRKQAEQADKRAEQQAEKKRLEAQKEAEKLALAERRQREKQEQQKMKQAAKQQAQQATKTAQAQKPIQKPTETSVDKKTGDKKSVDTKTSNKKTEDTPTSKTATPSAATPRTPTKKDEADTSRMKTPKKARKGEPERRQKTKFTVADALSESDDSFDTVSGPSLASIRRRREKEKLKAREALAVKEKIVRDVTIPETITVGDLANRMAERTADVIKELMKLGVMANATQSIDADTAELVVTELGHRYNRVSEADVEDILIETDDDNPEDFTARAPVVTIMGHVDHGKTSLLDALRSTDVAGGESGGITQHIGAYSVTRPNGVITFLDTPGHEAFTSMRERGANVTDIVVIVVAADDGIMPQTIEAINHATSASVPIIVAINKIDTAAADAHRTQTQLLEHGVQTEHFGGDVLCVEVSAKKRLHLDKLEDAILLQADMLELQANPKANPSGTIVESQLERGRGAVATVLMQRGTIKIGQIFVAGQQWGKVRAIINDRGENMQAAGPSMPVEILGWNAPPESGDDFRVVASEATAREITEYRTRKALNDRNTVSAKGSVDDIFAQIKQGHIKELPLILKADAHGSVEAIKGALAKFDNDEVKVRIVHSGTGGITESDVSLATSVNGLIFGFNVRANIKAREKADHNQQDIRYYSIIYDLIDDVKGLLSGMLAPEISEDLIGYATIRQVFKVSKLGNIAGCYVTDGMVKRGAPVRILRDDVIIYEGALKQLKREKDDVQEVKNSYECGMMFENYDDIKEGDVIECFERIETKRQL